MASYTCSTFYALRPLAQPERQEILQRLRDWPATTPPLKGLLIVAPDGINATIAGPAETVRQIENWLGERLPLSDIKRSQTDRPPFGLWKVVERRETVTSGPVGQAPPATAANTHLTPEQFHETLASEEVTLIDVRNDYEVRLGTFRGALDPKTKKFSDFAEFVDHSELPKDAKILTFCTGGIRCEKAVPFLKARGFSNVFQLSGGILNYLEHYPEGFFDGECFVFDERVAVDTHMNPTSQYRRCPKCGQPCGATCPDCGYSD